MSEIQTALSAFIVKEFMADSADAVVLSDEPLIREGIVDSLGIFLLITFLEERFGVKVRAEEVTIDNFQTLNAIERLVVSHQETGASA